MWATFDLASGSPRLLLFRLCWVEALVGARLETRSGLKSLETEFWENLVRSAVDMKVF